MRPTLPLVATLCATLVTVVAAERPNIVIIMSDDMGWSDLACYGGEIATPNLDRLASRGVRFTQFYNTARCCPTRASLLTGVYPHQAGIGHMMEDKGSDAYRGELDARCSTIAEALRPAGYRSYAVGKWHVTKKTRPTNDEERRNWPLQRGFDRFYGTIHGAGSFFDPNSLTRDNALISPFADPEYRPDEFFYTDAINDHAVRFVTEHRRDHGPQPFFLYVAHTAAHWPMHAREKTVSKYKGRYDAGYDAIRAARLARGRELGLVDSRWTPVPTAGDWSKVANREWEIRCMEVYAAMVDEMDQGIGRLTAALEKNGQLDNTLIFFLQDNGGCAEGMGRGAKNVPRADGPTLPAMKPDALQFDMIPKQTRDGYPVRQGQGVMPGGADTFIGYGLGWANVSNTPFREYKHWVHEGGISTPLIAHWPAGIPPARAGKLEPQPGHLIDLMATALDVSGATIPPDRKKPEGVSLRAALAGEPLNRARPIFFEHEGNRAVRHGQWKIVSKHNKTWELYDMAADRTETRDLAGAQPDRVRTMAAQYDAWAAEVAVRPWPLR
ncbi:MAG: arylsulfatase [Chthoniobacteraceae bacterium]